MAHQNWLATLVLVAWPFVAIGLFATLRLSQAIIWTILGAQLLLPVGALFKFAMIPQLDKTSIPNFCILIGCLIATKRRTKIFSGFGLTELLMVLYVLGPIATSEFNGEAISAGDTVLPGIGLYDGISSAELALITMLPFLVGRRLLRSAEHIEDLLRALVIAGLIYSLLVLFELRMSPNLQLWIYGFAATDFVQAIREGGYRPIVFMGHGLITVFFMMTTAVAAAAFWRARIRLWQIPSASVTGYLAVILLLCKSAGAALYGFVLIPAVRMARPRSQMRLATILVACALSYPMLRSFDVFPTRFLVDSAELISHDRALSLKYRFDNEDKLLKRAFEKPVFGWGRYGRNLVFDENSGRDESVTDGLWIIKLGQYGLIGFLSQFGLLAIAVFRSAAVYRLARSASELVFLPALTLIIAVSIVELIPNSGLLPWTWLISGALLGRSEALRAQVSSKQPRTAEAQMRTSTAARPLVETRWRN